MAKLLPKEKAYLVKERVYAKADEFSYSTRSRTENNQFLNSLVEDNEIAGVLREYMAKEKVRTYIKDTVLNAYSKRATKNALDDVSPTKTIQQIYGVESLIIQRCTGKDARMSVSRSDDNRFFVVSGGTVLKWETALRKALELIAREPGLTKGKTLSICLHLVPASNSLTDADKKHITTALATVDVQAIFCND